jgi:hypothetical protein
MREALGRRLMIGALLSVPLFASTIAMSRTHRWHWRHAHWRSSYGAVAAGGELTRADAARLRPGQYIWAGAMTSADPVSIVIDLGRQVAYIYQSSRLAGITTVSSGRRGYDTPTGTFPILQKAVWHRSTIYSGAPMPYMQRLTWGGVALHAGGVPGYRQSHGCIHLPTSFARTLFAVTRIGAIVEVTHGLPRAEQPPAPAPTLMMASMALPSTAQAVATMASSLL